MTIENPKSAALKQFNFQVCKQRKINITDKSYPLMAAAILRYLQVPGVLLLGIFSSASALPTLNETKLRTPSSHFTSWSVRKKDLGLLIINI